MARAVPILGHPTRSAAMRALFDAGLTTGQIALRLTEADPSRPASMQSVANALGQMRAKGAVLPVQVRLSSEDAEVLIEAAGARGLRADQLAARLLQLVLRDGLIDAILDDGGDE